MDAGAAIEVRGLSHTYRSSAGAVAVLDGVDLEVPAGGYVSLQGPSGAGKTTLLAIIGGLERPQEGVARVGDADLTRLGGDELAAFRRRTMGLSSSISGCSTP
jgi:ABC-type lipoprotein export system ATPase subunit